MEGDTNLCWTSKIGPFDEILVEIRMIKDFLSRLPQWLGELSTTYHYYVAQFDYVIYLKDQEIKGGTISRLERVYFLLVQSHQSVQKSQDAKEIEEERQIL